MKVLVTGANGFIGSAVIDRLLRAHGHTVRAAVRPGSAVLPPGVESIPGELHPERDWSDSMRTVDVVVHLAARVHVGRESSAGALEECRRVNVAGTSSLARAAGAAGVRRFIYLSSLKVHGDTGRFSEQSRPQPPDPYAQSKHEGELELLRVAGEHGMEAVIVRPPLVYGPAVQAHFRTLMSAVASGVPLPLASIRNRRSLIGIDNLVDFIMTCLVHPAAANQTFLVADDEDLSTPDLIRRLAAAMGRRPRLLPAPPSLIRLGATLCGRRDLADRLIGSLQADTTKARTRLAWSPPVSVDEGLRRTAQGR